MMGLEPVTLGDFVLSYPNHFQVRVRRTMFEVYVELAKLQGRFLSD